MSKTGNNKLTFLVIFKLTFLVKIILTILKRKAMERVNTSSDSTMNYQPSDDILEFLKNL